MSNSDIENLATLLETSSFSELFEKIKTFLSKIFNTSYVYFLSLDSSQYFPSQSPIVPISASIASLDIFKKFLDSRTPFLIDSSNTHIPEPFVSFYFHHQDPNSASLGPTNVLVLPIHTALLAILYNTSSDPNTTLSTANHIIPSLQAISREVLEALASLTHAYRLHHVVKIAAELAAHINSPPPDTLRHILGHAKAILHCDRATLYLVAPSGTHLYSYVTDLCPDGASDTNPKTIQLPFGHGIAGTVAATGQELALADAYAFPAFDPSYDAKTGYRTRSVLAVPIHDADRTLGVLQLINKLDQHGTPVPFSSEDSDIARLFGDFAAIILRNSAMLAHLQNTERRSQSLLRIAHQFGDTLVSDDFVRVINRIVMRSRDVLRCQRCSLYIVDPDTAQLVAVLSDNWSEGRVAFLRIPLNRKSVAGRCAVDGTTLVVDDAYAVPYFDKESDTRTGFRTQSILAVPFFDLSIVKGSVRPVIGVIQWINKLVGDTLGDQDAQVGPFDSADREFGECFASFVSIALTNTRIFSRIRLRHQRTTSLFAFATRLVSASNADVVLQLLTQQLATELHCSAIRLLLASQDPHFWRDSRAVSFVEVLIAQLCSNPDTSAIGTPPTIRWTLLPTDPRREPIAHHIVTHSISVRGTVDEVARVVGWNTHVPFPEVQHLETLGIGPIRTLLALPITSSDGVVIGVVFFVNKHRKKIRSYAMPLRVSRAPHIVPSTRTHDDITYQLPPSLHTGRPVLPSIQPKPRTTPRIGTPPPISPPQFSKLPLLKKSQVPYNDAIHEIVRFSQEDEEAANAYAAVAGERLSVLARRSSPVFIRQAADALMREVTDVVLAFCEVLYESETCIHDSATRPHRHRSQSPEPHQSRRPRSPQVLNAARDLSQFDDCPSHTSPSIHGSHLDKYIFHDNQNDTPTMHTPTSRTLPPPPPHLQSVWLWAADCSSLLSLHRYGTHIPPHERSQKNEHSPQLSSQSSSTPTLYSSDDSILCATGTRLLSFCDTCVYTATSYPGIRSLRRLPGFTATDFDTVATAITSYTPLPILEGRGVVIPFPPSCDPLQQATPVSSYDVASMAHSQTPTTPQTDQGPPTQKCEEDLESSQRNAPGALVLAFPVGAGWHFTDDMIAAATAAVLGGIEALWNTIATLDTRRLRCDRTVPIWLPLKQPGTLDMEGPTMTDFLSSESRLAQDRNTLSLPIRHVRHAELRPLPMSFRRISFLGRGAFGTVHLAQDQQTGRLIAVKTMLFDPAARDVQQRLAILQREISTMRRLRHPNITRYLGTQREGREVHILMEYVSGGSVEGLIKRYGPLSEPVAQRYAAGALRGLAYLHRQGIVHGDIKAANILVTSNGVAKLTDFGSAELCRRIAASWDVSVRGTVPWMAPEVLRAETVGTFSDIWSFGCFVMEMLTGKVPWSHLTSEVSEPNTQLTTDFSTNDTPSNATAIHQRTVPEIIENPLLDLPMPPGISGLAASLIQLCCQRNPTCRPRATALLNHPWIASYMGTSSSSQGTDASDGQSGSG